VPSWRALLGKLGRMKRLKIFDVQGVSAANYAEMLKPGRVNIVDLSDSDSTIINNLVIAELLRGIQLQQEENYEKAVKAQTAPTPVLIFIEEAHEFLSADRISRMQNVFAQVARIARRGRKRWLGLVFISQLPQHLPDEVLALINNWMIHKIGDSQVVSRLRKSIGGINDGLWKQLPALAPGQAVAAFTSMSRALLVNVDPTPCRLLMVE
jgi:DNA helicase HerA-like ATPase